MAYKDTDDMLLDQLKDLNHSLDTISMHLGYLVELQELQLKKKRILPKKDKGKDNYGALEMD